MRLLITLLLLMGLVSCALAQNIPTPAKSRLIVPGRYRIRDDAGLVAPAIVSGPLGVYVLNRGVLARFDAKTLQQQGLVELYGKLEDLPNDGSVAMQTITERAQRFLPAGMALHGGDLIIVSGDQFFRVDPSTLAIKVNASLFDDKQHGARVDAFLSSMAPPMEFSGAILYRVLLPLNYHSTPTITAIDSNTGKILAEKALPAELSTADWQYIQGGLTFSNAYAPPGMGLQVKATADAVYVLRNGALAKLDPKTLEPVKVKALFGPVVNIADEASLETKAAASIDRAQRTLPVVLLMQGNDLLIISGDDFFRVNADTLEINKQAQLTDVADDARAKRMGQLVSWGQPQVLSTPHGLLLTRGSEYLLVNPQDGSTHALSLPAPLTRLLPFLRPRRQLIKPVVPEDGKTIVLQGVAWAQAAGDNITWLFYDPQIGTVKLTGAKIDAISADPNNQQGQIRVQGIFHKLADAGPDKLVGTVDTIDNGNFMLSQTYFCTGTVHKRNVGDAALWTISSDWFDDCEFVLVGEKLKDLTAVPDIDGREVNLMGHFSKAYEKMPPYGRGYLEITNATPLPTPEMTAAQQEQACPALPAATEGSFFAIRNGMVARFDAATLAQTALCDLLPPVPDIPKDGEIPDKLIAAVGANRTLRMATPLAIPQGNDLSVLAGNYNALLDSITLKVKAQQTPGDASLLSPSIGNNNLPTYLVDGASLYTLYGNKLLQLDLTVAKAANAVDLPELMLKKIYPARN